MGTCKHLSTLKDMEGATRMFKFLPMNLQFFAEPPAEVDNPETPPAGDDVEGKEAEPAAGVEKKYSDADLDKIINQKFAKWQADSDEKLRQSQLTAEQKEQERIEKLEKLEKDVAKRDAIDASRKMLSEAKLPAEFAQYIYDPQDDVSKEKFDGFTKLMQTYRESVVNEIMKDKTPAKARTSENDGLSGWRERARQNYQKVKESE